MHCYMTEASSSSKHKRNKFQSILLFIELTYTYLTLACTDVGFVQFSAVCLFVRLLVSDWSFLWNWLLFCLIKTKFAG